MSVNSHVRQILKHVKNHSNDPVFTSFAKAISTQLRAPYRAKYSPATTVEQLQTAYSLAQKKSHDDLLLDISPTSKGFVLNSIMKDQPFIVDTIRAKLKAMGAQNISGYNALVDIQRNDNGDLIEARSPSKGTKNIESIIRFSVDINSDMLEQATTALRNSLTMAQTIVRDFKPMLDIIASAQKNYLRAAERSPESRQNHMECADFLEWLLQDNFVFMGVKLEAESFGLFASNLNEIWDTTDIMKWRPEFKGVPVSVRKGVKESPIHRDGQVDEILLEVPIGKSTSRLIVQGLFTYRAVNQTSRKAPVLRQLLGTLLKKDKCQPGSYRYKGICNVFDSLPTEFLFTTDAKRLAKIIELVLEAEQEQESRAQIVASSREDHLFVLTALPQSQWSNEKKKTLEQVLKSSTGASYCDFGVFSSRYDTVLVHFYLTGCHNLSSKKRQEIEKELVRSCTPWQARLNNALREIVESNVADALSLKYEGAFQETFMRMRPIEEAAKDIIILEKAQERGEAIVDLFVIPDRKRGYIRVYQTDNLVLSDVLPVIDELGLRVVDQFADPIRIGMGKNKIEMTIDTFQLEPISSVSLETLLSRKDVVCNALEAVFKQVCSHDSLNEILLHTGIPWQAVDMFRGLHGYAKQLGFPFSIPQTQSIMLNQTHLVLKIWEFFQAKFDPARDDNDLKRAKENAFDEIRKLQSRSQDTVFRTFFNLIDSILRTNFYRDDRTEHYISYKIDCTNVQNMPSPRMMFEIYVHHRSMEGIHLRGGSIARGGIRWSDRSDFRREVLDLVATQMVKNVLIIPEGAKGGFRMKEQHQDRGEMRRRADELYQILIRGMLDITDNLVGGQVTHPKNVRIHDDKDPYLVVAADKGTAHLSDTANSLSREYGFWLDDAFASGGSNGYDHKKVGITARGGWMAVKRHFIEMGINPENDHFTCVAIGDPAGDVFGNGVSYLHQKQLLNNKMKLLGAFNHLHIFLDPNPDAQKSFDERYRLFNKVAGWGEYDQSLLSEGGGIFSRSAKSIPLSPQIQEMLGVLSDELPPEVVIRLMLGMDVDLLWNGGIGTYIKSSYESDMDAGDPSNNQLRINATNLRAKIIGEGGNLGFTQNARVEYALSGGRINTDAIDNSGGVDMSDHEVNLKILLAPLVQSSDLKMDERNALLERMTEEVAQDVLGNNNIHALQLSLDKIRSEEDPLRFSSAINWICQKGSVTRTDLRLPSDEELIRRRQMNLGLTRPELAVLAAHVKMHIFKELKGSDISSIPGFNEKVRSYFPDEIQATYGSEIDSHMLHKSIGLTVILNEIVGEAGAWLFPALQDMTGANAVEIIVAWLNALETVNAEKIKAEIVENCSSQASKYAAWVALTKPLFSLVTLWLFNRKTPNTEEQQSIQKTNSKIVSQAGTVYTDRISRIVDDLKSKEVSSEVAEKIANLYDICEAYEINAICTDEKQLKKSIISYYSIGEASCLLPTIRNLNNRQSNGGWDPAANAILHSRFMHLQKQLVQGIDIGTEYKIGTDRVIQRLIKYHLSQFHAEMEDILDGASDLASLMVANARAQVRIMREYSGKTLKGTGLN